MALAPPARAALVARDLRADRARLVAGLASGQIDIGALVPPADTPAARAGLVVKTVVLAEAVPHVGKVRSRRILAGLGIAAGARWGELDAPVAVTLVAALRAASTAPGPGEPAPGPAGGA